jgi:excisionase family DNA binding protein
MHDSAPQFAPMRSSGGLPKIAYGVPDAAEQIDVSERKLWLLIQAGEIESFKIGRSRKVTHQALTDYVARQIVASKPAA